jgi:hypothetical protein
MLENELIEVDMILQPDTNAPNIVESKIKNEGAIFTVKQYLSEPTIINNLKLHEIKQHLKYYKNNFQIPTYYKSYEKKEAKNAIKSIHDFTLMGTKKILYEKLKKFFEQHRLVIIIQKSVRRFLTKVVLELMGPAKFNKKLCVNDSDFYTLEPLSNIPFDNFFSYKDKENFIYGFELSSLIQYIKVKERGGELRRQIKNPYNRNSMKNEIPKIHRLCQLRRLLKGEYNKHILPTRIHVRNRDVSSPQNDLRNRTLSIGLEHNYNHSQMLEMIRSIRSKSNEDRTRELFIEIDQLGNYSDYRWFMNLERSCYLRYYRILKDIWTYRAQIPSYTKIKICPLWDPFGMFSTINVNELTTEQLMSRCLCVMEDMIYTGIERQFKTIGALHVLSVLTVINREARSNMPWLYESLI